MVAWSKDLEIGIEIIDKQHKAIFDEINQLAEVSSQEEWGQTYEALEFIEDYVKKHFKTEEFFLSKYEYEDLENHIQLHEGFIKQLNEYKNNHKRSGIKNHLAFNEIMKIILEWWYYHILKTDREYVDFLHAKIALDNK